MSVPLPQLLRSPPRPRNFGNCCSHNDCHGRGEGQGFNRPGSPARCAKCAGHTGTPLHCTSKIRSPLPEEGEGGACPLRQASSGLPATPAEESQGPRVKPFTPDPTGPSERELLATVMIRSERSTNRGAGGIGTRSGLDAGGATPHNPRLPLPDAITTTSTARRYVSRASRPARSRSGAGASAGRSKRRRVRTVSARLEDV